MTEKARRTLAGCLFGLGTDMEGMTSDEIADSILAALKEAGYVVVPVEPTEEMIRAAHKSWFRGDDENWKGSHSSPDMVAPHLAETYRATVAASQQGEE